MQRLLFVLVLLAFPLNTISLANAAIVKGDLTLHDNAFADTATVVSGSVGNGRPLSEILAGPDLGTSLGIGDFNRGEIIDVSFLNNTILNRPGYDLVIYEKHAADGFDLALEINPGVFSEFRHFETTRQNFSENGYVNAAFVDLSDYGLLPMSTVDTIRVLEDDGDSAELAGFAAIHSAVPEPGTIILALLALLGVASQKRTAF